MAFAKQHMNKGIFFHYFLVGNKIPKENLGHFWICQSQTWRSGCGVGKRGGESECWNFVIYFLISSTSSGLDACCRRIQHVPICLRHRWFLRFQIGNYLYHYRVLTFDLNEFASIPRVPDSGSTLSSSQRNFHLLLLDD